MWQEWNHQKQKKKKKRDRNKKYQWPWKTLGRTKIYIHAQTICVNDVVQYFCILWFVWVWDISAMLGESCCLFCMHLLASQGCCLSPNINVWRLPCRSFIMYSLFIVFSSNVHCKWFLIDPVIRLDKCTYWRIQLDLVASIFSNLLTIDIP